MVTRLSVVALLVLGIDTSVGAQGMRSQHGLGVTQAIEPFEVGGTLEAIAQGKIKLLGRGNQQLIVTVGPYTQIELTGKATPDFLAPGTYVRFNAEFDEHGTAKDKVSQLTIFTPTRGTPLGIKPLGGNEAEAPAGKEKPAAAPAGSKRRGKSAAALSPGMYAVAAPLSNVQEGKFTVGSGTAALKFEVADDATIEVNTSDLRFARAGDKIMVKGRKLAGQMPRAEQVKIEAAVPFSDPRAKQAKAAKPAAKHESQPAKKTDSAQGPAADAK